MPKESASSTAFPRGLDDLIDTTRCPACFTPLRSTTCHNCGLDLSQPGAAELANTSKQAAELLRRRDELIGQLRQQVPDASAPAPASPGATPPPVSTPAPGSAPVQVPAAAAAAPASPAPAGTAEPRRHLGVQVILLIVGVALLSIGAIFFLVYAFITFGLVWRSVIIGAVTVAAFAGASLLRRRKLGATAEAIAALAVVLVYLDAFAVRANDLFGAAAADALVYWGITLLVSAVGFVLWHRLSRLRLPSIVGFAAFPIGAALLAAGLTEGLDTLERVFVGFAGAALGGLVHVVARGLGTGHALERLLVLSLGAAGLAGAGITANWLRPDLDWGAAVGLGIVAVLALAHVLVLLRTEGPRVLTAIVAIIGTIAASTAVLSAAVRMPDSGFTRVAPLVAAAVIALVLEFAQRRSTAEPARTPSLVAVWTAVGIGALTAVPAVFIAAVGVFEFAGLPLTSGFWSVLGTERIPPGETGSSAVLALAVVVALTAAAWALNSTLAKRRYLVLTATAVVLVLAVPLVGVLWAATTCWLAIAGFAVILFVVGRGSGQGMRLLLAGTGVAALALGYAASWASLDTWWLGSLAAIAALIALRLGVGSTAIRAGLLGTALVLLGIAAGAGAWRLNEVVTGGAGRATEAVHGVLALAVLVLALAALVRRPLSSLDTRVAFWLAGAAAVVAAPLAWLLADGRDRLVAPDPVATAALGSALVGALVLWSVLPRARAFGVEAIAASLAVAPAGAMALHWLARAAGLDESVVALAPVVAALIVAATALVTDAPALRAARDAGGAVVTVAVIGWALVSSDAAWLVLVLGAVTVLLFAVSRDGLFGSASPRKHLGWVALALATAGLWTRLALSEVVQLAAYVLPLAGALLLVALLAWRAARPEPSRTAPYIALGGLLVAGVPLAVDSFDGDHLVRTIVVAAVAAVLALAGSFTRARAELRPYLDAAAFAGGLTLLLTVTVHASGMLARGQREDATIDVWLAAALIVIVVAALGQQRLEGRTRAIVGQVVFGVALAAVTVVELASIELDTLGTARAVITIAVLGAVHVAAVTAHRAPLSRLIGWLALALAAIVALFAILGTAADPLELATVPLAAALLIAGAVRMRSTAAARSWAWLAPGILVLLVPSLLATFTEDTAWRLVLLGLACVAAIVVGALARLQAPLILGSVIVLIHAIRTFAPQLRAVYESTEWWVWAVVGGAIILFLGFTLERRIRNLKAVAARVSALR